MRDDSKIAVLILGHGKPDYTSACCNSVLDSTSATLELVLVNNGSPDDLGPAFDAIQKKAKVSGHTVRRINFDTNVGAICGRNAGFEVIESRFVAWVDSDVLACSRGWLEHFANFLRSNPDVAIVGPKLIYPWAPHNIQCAGCDVSRSGRVVFRGRGAPRDVAEFNSPRDCATLISATWLMEMSIFDELGGLDERFNPVQFEDIDYCYRARQIGKRVVYLPEVEMYHFEGMTTTRSSDINYDSTTARNSVKFKRKWQETILSEGGIDDGDVPAWSWDVGWQPLEVTGIPPLVPIVSNKES